MKTAGPILGIVLAAALGACAKEKTQTAAAPPPGQAEAMAAACPMAQIPGVQASVADINKGVAITFTGPQRSLDELRKNVHAMATANDKQGDAFAVCPCAGMMPGQGAAEAMPGTAPGATAMMRAIPAKASVDDIETGAVLKLTAKDDSQIQPLRDAAKQNVQALRQGCLSPQGQGQPYQQYQQQYPSPTEQYQPQSQQPSQQYPQPPPASGPYGEPRQQYSPPQPTQQ